MPNPRRATAAGRWSPMTRCIRRFDTNACTAPESVKPRTSAHSVSQNMKNASRRLSPMSASETNAITADHDRTSRAIAAEASAIFSSAAAPPSPIASATQCARCWSSSSSATACSALVGGGDLGQHVDAVGVVVDHALHAADLTLDAAQPLLDRTLLVGVAGHAGTIPR